MLVSSSNKWRRTRMLHLLDELATAVGAARSLYLPPGSPVLKVEEILSTELALEEVSLVRRQILKSTTGAVLFWGKQHRYLIQPPFPVREELDLSGYAVEPLRALLLSDSIIALVLVRLGAYAIGVFQGEKLLSSKVGTGNVHQRHRQGGSSQHRFERHREKQIEQFFTRICTHVQEQVTPYISQLGYVAYGGTRYTVLGLRRQCQFLRLVDDRTLGLLLNVREPRQATLEKAIGDVWASKVIEWRQA